MLYRPHVLIVDDDELDVIAWQRAFDAVDLGLPVHTAADGEQGVELVRGRLSQEALGVPLVMLLDLNMPRLSGLDLLEQLSLEDRPRHLTTFVTTSSYRPIEIRRAYDLGIAGFVIKQTEPTFIHRFAGMLKSFVDIVVLPGGLPGQRHLAGVALQDA